MVDLMNEFGIGGGGDLEPNLPGIIKFDARDGTWHLRKDDGWEPIGITNMQIAVDLDNFEKGYNCFVGGRPDYRTVRHDDLMPASPGEEYKPCFRVRMYCKKLGFVAFSSNSMFVINKMNTLLNEYLSEPHTQGEVAIIRLVSLESHSTKNGTFHSPAFSIEKTVPRPAKLVAKEFAEPKPKPKKVTKSSNNDDEFADDLETLKSIGDGDGEDEF